MGRTVWTLANVVMLLMFIASVAVQVNDPDPIRWMAIYGAAAVATGVELARRARPPMPMLIAAIAIVWALTIAPRVIGKVPFGSMFAAFEMKDIGVEESREMYGLVLIALWMGAISVAAWRRQARRTT